jgi:hypothetical protein
MERTVPRLPLAIQPLAIGLLAIAVLTAGWLLGLSG